MESCIRPHLHPQALLSVEDDGDGGTAFAPDGGLAGLAQRARAVDGTLVVSSPHGGPTVVEAALTHRPDLSIVDVRMPPSHTDEGLRAVVEVRREWPEARVMVPSQYVELSYAEDLLAHGEGGIGYLLKDRVSDIEDFVASAERVATGGTVTEGAVEKYSARLFAKLGLLPNESGHRGVRAVLAWLQRG